MVWLWLIHLLGGRKAGYKFTQDDEDFNSALKVQKQRNKMEMLKMSQEDAQGGGIARVADDIRALRELNEELGLDKKEDVNDYGKQLIDTFLSGAANKNPVPDDISDAVEPKTAESDYVIPKQMIDAVKSGKVDKKQFDKMSGELYKSLKGKKVKK